LPRSIENYVQEIGRAGRDGTLARCHMFLNNDDFYQLRRITLSDLLDNQSGYRLTAKLVAAAKNDLFKLLCPDKWVAPKRGGGKRKKSEFDADHKPSDKFLNKFENEKDFEQFYT